MLPITNMHADGVLNAANPAPSPLIAGLTFKGNNLAVTLHCITARPLTSSFADATANPAGRMSNTCYVRGFKERMDFVLAAGETVQWRRIVFAGKGLSTFQTPVTSTSDGPCDWQPSGRFNNESFRSMVNLNAHAKYAAVLSAISEMFVGQSGIDFLSVINAKPDRTNFQILSDRVVNVVPSTTAVYQKTYTMWHPINRSITYNYDEDGDELGVAQMYSTTSRIGLGDVYVLDMFQGVGSATSVHKVASQSTYYWHEK